MNFDLDIDNYSKDDYMDIFNLDKSMNPSKETVEKNYKNLLNNIEEENLDQDEKKKIKVFLTDCRNNLINLLKKDKEQYKLIESDFIPDLDHSETFQNNNKFLIKRNRSADKYHTNKINPIAKQTKTQLININTKFRKSYYDTNATDFVIDLPEEFKNVISLTVQSVQIPNSNYTYSSDLGTNEFSVELYDIDTTAAPTIIAGTQEKKTIKITNGIYNGNMLEDYLNTYVFTDMSLNRIACSYDDITRKFRFFRDYRSVPDGGQPEVPNRRFAFNLDFRLSADQNRPIQLNMGWILGYRQQYYDWDTDFTDSSGVSFNKQEGYNPEATYDTLGSKYYILSIDDFNKNYSNTLTSPFQESMFNDQNALAKIPNNPNLQQLDDIFYQSRREYFGPVNIKKMHIKLLDELGRVVNLNNNDFSFSIVIEQLYDAHANKIFN
tara:strand:- start:4367 stop:5677 length:1311 start_codon:yes stop_codon:yes gene_type:complete